VPEGPEIRQVADKIAAALSNQEIKKVFFLSEPLKQHQKILIGATVKEIETRGKAILTHFDNGYSIYSHNQLYGRWYIVNRDKFPSTKRSLRLALHTETKSALLYSASEIAVLKTPDVDQHPFLSRIGPDILSPKLSWRDVARRISSKKFKKRCIAGLLLNQSFLAGLGNYLRSEILFAAKIDPTKRPSDLQTTELNCLAKSIITISQRAYETGGITNPNKRVNVLRKNGLSRQKLRHAVFSRKGLECYDCGDTVLQEYFSGRRLYFCPRCQLTED
jgi:endonuclease-8